jgi:type IV pilus assembly protein PilV
MINRARAGGFTLIEVMVALIVTTIGLLGIAKVQALAYASNGSASVRSLVATEAAGLASAMRANRAYWAAVPTAVGGFTVVGTTISDATLNPLAAGSTFAANLCAQGGGGPCVPQTMAANDLHIYGAGLAGLVNNATTTVICPAGAIPLNCTIQVTWNEKNVAVNTNAAGIAMAASSYTLYVQP